MKFFVLAKSGKDAADPSLQMPKEWHEKMFNRVKKGNPSYDEKTINETVGKIWSDLGAEKKSQIRQRYGKTYGPAKKKSSLVITGMHFELHGDRFVVSKTTAETNDKNKGVDKKYIVRQDVSDDRYWVYEIYFADKIGKEVVWRGYPNVISARYLSEESAKKGAENYMETGDIDFYDEDGVEPLPVEESLKDFGLKVSGENPQADILSDENLKRLALDGLKQGLKADYESPDPIFDGVADYIIDSVSGELGRELTDEEIERIGDIVQGEIDSSRNSTLKPKLSFHVTKKAYEPGDFDKSVGEGGAPKEDVDVYEADADDIILIGENEQDLYNSRFIPIYKNLTLKKNRGVYDPTLAPKLFRYLVDEGAKLWYERTVQWADDGKSRVVKPSVAVRDEAAKEMARVFEEEYANKSFDFMEDPKARSFRPKKVKEGPKETPAEEPKVE